MTGKLLDQSRFRQTNNTTVYADLNKQIEAARAYVNTHGLPTRKDEAYKYTNIEFLKDLELEWSEQKTNSKSQFDHFCLVENGNFDQQQSLPENLELYSISQLKDWPDKIKSEFHNLFLKEDVSFEDTIDALNYSDLENGVFLRVARGKSVNAPLHLLFTDQGMAGDKFLISNFKVYISVEESAEFTLIQEYSSSHNLYRNNKTEVKVAKNARFNHMSLQWDGDSSVSFYTTHITQERDSFVHNQCLSLGSKLSRNNVVSNIVGENCDIELFGSYLLSEKQHSDHNTKINHIIGHSRSNQIYKGLLDDQSRAVMNGKVYIEQDAQKTDSSQLNKNLVLTEKAAVDTKPELEVYADDVKAAHGATVGQLDKDEIFYFRSRAIDEKTANKMISEGFIKELAFMFPNEKVKEYALAAVDQKISSMNMGSVDE